MIRKTAPPPTDQDSPSDGRQETEISLRATPKKQRRGFAAMDPQKQQAIASRGGTVAHEVGHAHEFTVEEARTAGQKGGQVLSQDRAHMVTLGRRSGEARRKRAAAPAETSDDTEKAPIPAPTKAQP